MRWTHKLSEEEFKMLAESLKNLFNSIDAVVLLDNTPTKLYESMNSIGQNDSWETYNYNIKIKSKHGNYEALEGFDDSDIKTQIKNTVKTIGMEYCLRYDRDRKTLLAHEIDEIR